MAHARGTRLDDLFTESFAGGRVLAADGPLGPSDRDQVVEALAAARVRAREAVGLCLENGRRCLAAYAALAHLDAVAVPLPPTMPAAERRRLWAATGCRVVLDHNQGVVALSDAEGPVWPADIHWVMHSSGSTGIPKAIPLTLTALDRNARDVMETLDLGTDLLHIGTMSQCYTNGLYNSFLLPLLTGGRALSAPVATALKVATFIDLLRTFRPEILWVNPMVVSFLMRRASAGDLASARALISCTAPLSREDCLEAEGKLGRPVLQSYGLTETLIVSLEAPDRDASAAFSAGKAVGGEGAVSIDGEGALIIHNGAVTPGYAAREGGRLRLFLPNGEPGVSFVSGDLARLEEGRLTITGRRTNVINVGGVKVSPEQMEEVLAALPNVAEAAVGGVADRHGSETPVALIRTRGAVDTAALADRCATALGAASRPARILVVDEIPRTTNGKIDRPRLAALLSALAAGGRLA